MSSQHKMIFPHQKECQELEILFVGEKEHHAGLEILNRQLPQSHIHQLAIADILAHYFSNTLINKSIYNYIYIEPYVGKVYGEVIFQELHHLLRLLKPDGMICTTVYGHAGYYGLDMLSTIVKQFFGDGSTCEDVLEHLDVAHAVVTSLSVDHPAYRHQEFMAQLLKGESHIFKELWYIASANIFTVSRLLETISQNGGQFLDWVQPHLYEPGQSVLENRVSEKLNGLPCPQRWEVAELVNAAPNEHCFLMTAPSTNFL